MSIKHWMAIFITCIYLFVVGFAEFPPRETANDSVKLIPVEIPIPLPVSKPTVIVSKTKETKPSTSSLGYEESMEKIKIAKVISDKYGKIDYTTAMQLVTTVYDHSEKRKLDPKLVLAVIATESSFNSKARSHRNAIGYLQVIPKWHYDKIKGRNIWDMHVNVEVGVRILSDCYSKHRSHRNALGCYNGATNDIDKDSFYSSIFDNKRRLLTAVAKSG